MLSTFIEDVHVIVPTGRSNDIEWLPDGRTTLFFRVAEAGQRADLAVAGPRTRALYKNATGVEQLVGFQFKPGWSASLLGVTANELTDRAIPLQDVWGRVGEDLYDVLLAARSLKEVAEHVSSAIALRAQHTLEPASERLARRAVGLLEAGGVRIESVAQQLGVTSRHLRRAFKESVGVGPKDFARTLRFQRAVRMAAVSSDWACIAANAGYYDQAHLIADFRELVGHTPRAFLKRPSARPYT